MDWQGTDWGAMIRTIRLEQGLSQRQLAIGARVNRSTLRRLEEGDARGEIVMIERVLNYMGYEMEVMLEEAVDRRREAFEKRMHDPEFRSRLAVSRLNSILHSIDH